MSQEAIVLAGGMGTRLQSVVSDLPKPMAPINGIPFLSYIFQYLLQQGIKKVILSTGYKHEKIASYYGKSYKEIEIAYSFEDEPLGTGGAIKKALDLVREDFIYILNGDTFFNIDLAAMLSRHIQFKNNLTLALKPLTNFNRYGTVEIQHDRVMRLQEKQACESGLINGGIYLAERTLFSNSILPERFSFEKDFLERYVNSLRFGFYLADEYFIDIGIPEDYAKAQDELVLLV